MVEHTKFGRRSYLSHLGVATGTVALGGVLASTSARADDGVETVTVPAGEREVIVVDDGEALANTVYDVTADGAGVTIVAQGTNWTIRDVAVRGAVDMGDATVLGVADTGGGTSRIENVWLGDGSVYEQKGATGVWVAPDHDGHLEIEGVTVQQMSDNGFYCSPPGPTGGTVSFDSCVAANNWVAQYRLAKGSLERCTAAVTDDRQYRQGRGCWAWPGGPVTVSDSAFAMNGHHYSFVAGATGTGSEITVTDTEWDDGFHGGSRTIDDGTVEFGDGNGTDPRYVIPEGCPASIQDVVSV